MNKKPVHLVNPVFEISFPLYLFEGHPISCLPNAKVTLDAKLESWARVVVLQHFERRHILIA
jgi:hypothetical protein